MLRCRFSFSWSGNVSINSFIKFISNQLPLWDQHSKPKKKWPYICMFTRAIEITRLINHEIWYGCGSDRNISTDDNFFKGAYAIIYYIGLYDCPKVHVYIHAPNFRVLQYPLWLFYSRLIIKYMYTFFIPGKIMRQTFDIIHVYSSLCERFLHAIDKKIVSV